MDKDKLPPLPESIGLIVGERHTPPGTKEFWGYFSESYKSDQKQRVYTAEQMQDYALAALASLPAAPAQPPEGWDEMRKALQDIDHIAQAFHEGGYGESGNQRAYRQIPALAQTWLKFAAAPAQQPVAASLTDEEASELVQKAQRETDEAMERLDHEPTIAEANAYFYRLLLSTNTAGSKDADKYHELLFAVGMKHPGETRHETALRYIREAESPKGSDAALAQGEKK